MGKLRGKQYMRRMSGYKDDSRRTTFAKDMLKAVKSIKVGSGIWDVEWGGFTFSVRPFLCMAFGLYNVDYVYEDLCSIALESDRELPGKLRGKSEFENEYMSVFTEDENLMVDSLLSGFNRYDPAVARYALGVCNAAGVRKVMVLVLHEFLDGLDQGTSYIKLWDSRICNTQAFCYYLSFCWLLQKSSQLRFYLQKEIKQSGMKEKLAEACPECCMHYKCLAGEITASELADWYGITGPVEGVRPVLREIYCLASGDKGYPDDDVLHVVEGITTELDLMTTYKSFKQGMYIFLYVRDLHIQDKVDESGRLADKLSVLESKNSSLSGTLDGVRGALRDSKKQVKALEDELKQVKVINDLDRYVTKISKLEKEVEELRAKLAVAESDIESKSLEAAEAKREARALSKGMKQFAAAVLSDSTAEEAEEGTADEHGVGLEEACSYLKYKSIGVFGGYDAGSIEGKFSKYGLDVHHCVDSVSFEPFYLDCAVIITTNIKHRLVWAVQSRLKCPIVYVSGTNVGNMIMKAYEALKDEERV